MLRRTLSILCVILILGTSLALGASAAVSISTTIYQPTNTTFNNNYLEYFAIFNDTKGYLISFNYFSLLKLDVTLNDNSLDFSFYNQFPATYNAQIVVRDISSGSLLSSLDIEVNSSSTYNTDLYTILGSNASFPFSQLKYIEHFRPSNYVLNYYSANFTPNTVNWLQPVDQGYLLSVLPEPVVDSSNYFFVMQDKSGNAYLYSLSWTLIDGSSISDFQLQLNSVGNYELLVWNKSDPSFHFDLYINIFDISNGYFISSQIVPIYGNILYPTTVNLNQSYINFPNVKVYGLTFMNPNQYAVSLPSILWNFDRVNAEAIASGTLLLLNQLYAINRSLGDIEDLLILELMDLNFTLEQIYDILDRVYNAEPETFEQPSSDAVNEYLEDESAIYDVLPTGMVDNIDTALGSPKTVFEGNGAFGLIRSLMQGLAFNNSKINGLILFALAMGIAVLILGRRLNT